MANVFNLDKAIGLVTNSDTDDDCQNEVTPVIQFDDEPTVFGDMSLSHTEEVESTEVNVSTEEESNDESISNSDEDYINDTESDTDSSEEESNTGRDPEKTASPVHSNSLDDTEPNDLIVNDTDEHDDDEEESNVTQGRSRKRKRNFDAWKSNLRKRRRQAGKSYERSTGEQVQARSVKTTKDCRGKCKYKCAQKIPNDKRNQIFSSFWKLNDTEKSHFYSKTVNWNQKERNRGNPEKAERRKYSYAYNFIVDGERIRVCKEFYLTTLNISQRRVSYFFTKKHNKTTDTPVSGDMRGTRTKDRISPETKQQVRDHIRSFPKVESHYCRASTKMEYLAANLSLSKMFRLYKEHCSLNDKQAVKIHTYRQIFNSEFNLSFHTPKKDRCDRCEEYRIKSQHNDLDEELREEYMAHIESKKSTKINRDTDRSDKNKLVVCFDLENVLSCPQSNISSFFYRRKISVYNLTAHCSIDGQGYCAIWNETQSGRSANDICSALIAILQKVCEKHSPRHITLWSDSCVAQNRNSGMAFALKDFIRNSTVETIEQKFCEPGHSSIQEVDAIHSLIERELVRTEVYSPLGIMRVMKAASPRKPFCVIQMRDEHFKKYIESSRLLNFSTVPFTKVKSITSHKDDLYNIEYRTNFLEEEKQVSIRPRVTFKRMASPPRTPTELEWPTVKTSSSKLSVSAEKAKDIRAMLKFMSPTDRTFMAGLVK